MRMEVRLLHGGWSGSRVLQCQSFDARGQPEEATVVKLDGKEDIKGELAELQRLQKLLRLQAEGEDPLGDASAEAGGEAGSEAGAEVTLSLSGTPKATTAVAAPARSLPEDGGAALLLAPPTCTGRGRAGC